MKKVFVYFVILVGFLSLCTNYSDARNERPPLSGWRFCLDPGHGGTDSGALSPPIPIGGGRTIQLREADVNLSVARHLRNYLRGAGAFVIMTRESDINVSDKRRVAIANENNAHRFISIHHNAAGPGDHRTNGTETYRYLFSDVHIIYNGLSVWEEMRREHWSTLLAEGVHKALLRELGLGCRGIKPDTASRHGKLYVLRYTRMPAILVECSFISNRRQAEMIYLCHNNYLQRAASAIYQGILNHKEGLTGPPRGAF